MRDLHDHCPLALRVWEGPEGRQARVVDEILSYEADFVCLQEVTPRMFERDVVAGMYNE
ncbi:hypothetical protein T484DRAFT_1831539 [Baffinella frigidus]|nr:hypothetical protein T484DRAFT_1831539 [Cryptophyta sp. CCMP2293]